MLYQLLFIHLYRPFLKYTRANTPLPHHVSPRKLCTQAASTISKYLRVYKRTYGFKQICNVVVYMAHTACTIHLLNLPEKSAQRDVVHCLRHLDEMGESWLCARRTLRILDISANKWQVELPSEAVAIFEQSHTKWGSWGSWDLSVSPSASHESASPPGLAQHAMAVPSNLSSPPRVVSVNEHGVPFEASPGAARPQYVTGVSTPTTAPSSRSTQRSLNSQLMQKDTQLPEPTYLRPIAHTYNPLQTVPMTQYDAWYNPSDRQVPTGPTQTVTSSTNSSPMTGFNTPENLVEESQDWWTRDPSTLGMAPGTWPQWDPRIAGPPFENNIPVMRQTSGPSTSQPLQPVRLSNASPRTTQPGQNPDMTTYDNSIVFPANFQP